MAGERNNTHITWSNWSLVLKTDARIHSAVVRAGLMYAGICTHTHKKGSGASEYLTNHDSKIIVNNSESTDIHAATQHKTNPSSDDDNRTHHWAIEQKGPDRGVDAVPVAERRRRRPGELASGRRRVWIGNAESSSAQGRTLGGQRRRSRPRCGGGLLESRECQYL